MKRQLSFLGIFLVSLVLFAQSPAPKVSNTNIIEMYEAEYQKGDSIENVNDMNMKEKIELLDTLSNREYRNNMTLK